MALNNIYIALCVQNTKLNLKLFSFVIFTIVQTIFQFFKRGFFSKPKP